MTEAEWLACADPTQMLEFLDDRASERQLRLFACACCRRNWHRIPPYHRRTVEVAERYADGLVTRRELQDSYQVGENRPGSLDEGDFDPAGEGEDYDPYCVPWPSSATTACCFDADDAAEDASYWSAALAAWTKPQDVHQGERTIQAHLLRHITGNPFHPFESPDKWPSTVVNLAEALYSGQDCTFALHDALVEAGYPELADHFRQEEWHPKGCWGLDVILGNR